MREYQTRAAIIAHLNAKVEEEDWAAVREAAIDLNLLEILEARSPTAFRLVDRQRPTPLDG
jgi:hypothetical protein